MPNVNVRLNEINLFSPYCCYYVNEIPHVWLNPSITCLDKQTKVNLTIKELSDSLLFVFRFYSGLNYSMGNAESLPNAESQGT